MASMKHFRQNELRDALIFAAGGGLALHTHRVIPSSRRAPRCFVQAVARGEDIAHLFCLDAALLRKTAVALGVRVVYIDREGTPSQHIDLCSGPLRKALGMCDGG